MLREFGPYVIKLLNVSEVRLGCHGMVSRSFS